MITDLQTKQHDALLDSVEAMLRPVVPLFLSFGVTYAELADLVRGLFAQATADELKKEGRPVTSARLGLVTGINRGLVESLLAGRQDASARRREAEEYRVAIATILERWHDDSRFSTLYGIPLDLGVDEHSANRRFSELSEIACPGVDPDLLADELVIAGCAAYTDDGSIRCLQRMFIPTGLDPSAIAQIGQTTSTLTSTMVRNLLRQEGDPSYFGRSIFSDSPISQRGFTEFLKYLNSEGQAFLEKTDRWMNSDQKVEKDPQGKRIGMYLYVYDLPESPSPSLKATAASNATS